MMITRSLVRGCNRKCRGPVHHLPARALHQHTSKGNPATSAPNEIRLYKGSYLMPLRILLRAKLAQLGAASAFAVPLGMAAMGNNPSPQMLGFSAAILTGCGVASGALYFYGRRQAAALLTRGALKLRISTLSFWGSREDNVVDVSRVVAPFEGLQYQVMAAAAQSTFFPMILADDRTYILTLRWCPLEAKFKENTQENQLLVRLLRGRLTEESLVGLTSHDEQKETR